MRERLFNKRMVVKAVQRTSDGLGGTAEAELSVGGYIPCRCEALRGTERLIYAREGVDVSHRLWCGGNVALNAGRQVRIGDTNYDVQFVRERGGRTKHLEVDLLELRHDAD